jgi:prophage antirepressor-like protein
MNDLTVFEHQDFGEIRTQKIKQEPWFLAKDICDALELPKPEASIRKLDDDEKLMRKIFASGQNRNYWFVNESGLYNLIFRSNKPEAKAFRKWVTSEVLPSIRRTGSYQSPMRYIAQSNKQLGQDFENLALKELLKVESRRVRNRLAGLIEFYVSQIQ